MSSMHMWRIFSSSMGLPAQLKLLPQRRYHTFVDLASENEDSTETTSPSFRLCAIFSQTGFTTCLVLPPPMQRCFNRQNSGECMTTTLHPTSRSRVTVLRDVQEITHHKPQLPYTSNQRKNWSMNSLNTFPTASLHMSCPTSLRIDMLTFVTAESVISLA